MLRSRIIPCLLIKNRGLVKTIKFNNPKYVGDPINAVKIFNEKGADELIVLDIDATKENREPDYNMIKNLAAECRMPLCYGGGVKTTEQVKKIISLGVEKVAISKAVVDDPYIISRAAEIVGNQSIVVVIDVKKRPFINKYQQFVQNGEIPVDNNVQEFVKRCEHLGAGEVVINSIDRDGTMQGYDLKLVEKIKKELSIPISVLGGASSLENISQLIKKYGLIGAAAGSLFVFKGKYRAVLINYPNSNEKEILIK
jgi:imidazole glycerol-phosphate synthase subunit HisF